MQAVWKPNDSSDKWVGTQHSSHTLGRCLANTLEPKCEQVTNARSSESQGAGKALSHVTLREGVLLLLLAAPLPVRSMGVMASTGDVT